MADPTEEKARQQLAAGTARTHLENYTGKKRRTSKRKPDESSQKAEAERTQIRRLRPRLNSLRNVGVVEARSSE